MAPPTAATCPWGVTAEALFLKAYSNEEEYDDQDAELGYRLEFFYKNGDNLGLRLRYFDWEGTGSSNDDYPEMSAFDVEVFDSFTLGSWAGEYSLGLRWAEFQEDQGDDTDFEGWGPTLSVDMMRPITGPLSVYANARTSLVFGDDDENYDDSFVPIFELGLGLQYDVNLFGDCESYIRVGVEAQNWASISSNDNEDAGFLGAAVKFGTSF